MNASNPACFGYRIYAAGEGWAWMTYDLEGGVAEQGWAPEKALAAACVIRALARDSAPAPTKLEAA